MSLPDPFELIKKILPPLPFQIPEAAAGPPNPLELLMKLLPQEEEEYEGGEGGGGGRVRKLEKF